MIIAIHLRTNICVVDREPAITHVSSTRRPQITFITDRKRMLENHRPVFKMSIYVYVDLEQGNQETKVEIYNYALFPFNSI